MTLEELFVKKYEEVEKEKRELEKEVKGLKIDLKRKEDDLCKVADLLERGFPKLTTGGCLSLALFISDKEVEENNYLKLFQKLGVKVEEQK